MKEHGARRLADVARRHHASQARAASARLTVKTACQTRFPVKRNRFLRLHTSWDLLHTRTATCKVMHGNVSESRPRRLLLLPRLRRCQYI